MNPDQDNRHQILRQEVQALKNKLTRQEALLQGKEEWEGSQYYTEVEQLEAKRVEKQKEYCKLMKERHRFVTKNGWVQKTGQNYLEEKLEKGMRTLIRQIQNLLDNRSSKSSLSNGSLFDRVQSVDWLLHDRSQKYIKQHEKIAVQIAELEKILENIK